MATTKQLAAIDLSHHLSALSIAREDSPFKGLHKYRGPGMISLAGGWPDPALFPFAAITGDVLVPQAANQSFFSATVGAEKTQSFTVPKYPVKPGDISLSEALRYSPATGLQQLQDFIYDFSDKVHRPAYADWETLVDTGNTDGIYKAVVTLCNPGERILVEEWTYPFFLGAVQPMNVLPASVKIDAEGMSSIDLERVLAEWDEAARHAKRPHVLYTVPIGQNPTGATMSLDRKKAIYAVCVKYDVIIIEDDPYFFLQQGAWRPRAERALATQDDQTPFLDSLTPSFLHIDYHGRVVRLDSFSKIIAPGSRMGWFTANPLFIERFGRQGETTTLAPCGFSQALMAQLVTQHWGLENFMLWLRQLQAEYTTRRDFLLDAIFDTFKVCRDDRSLFGEGGPDVYTAYPKVPAHVTNERDIQKSLFSFVPPSSGMYVWLELHLQDMTLPTDELESRLWKDLADHGLLVVPGNWFCADKARSMGGKAHFRLSFSMGKHEELKEGVDILASVLNEWVAKI